MVLPQNFISVSFLVLVTFCMQGKSSSGQLHCPARHQHLGQDSQPERSVGRFESLQIYLQNRCGARGLLYESACPKYSSEVNTDSFRRRNSFLRLRGGGNRGKGACARRRQRKADAIQIEEGDGNATASRDSGSANGTSGINGTTAYHYQAQEDDGAFSALDRLLDNPVIASFAEKLFADAKFQA
jgi:hypothetical protein